jgi:hypothetical protein
MDLGIRKAIDNGDGNTLIYTALLAAVIANCTPTVADGWYFYLQDKWTKEKEDGTITPEAFWRNDLLGYYGVTAGYYMVILLTMIALGKSDFTFKSRLLLGLLGGGVAIGVVMKNIERDKKLADDKAKLATTPKTN